MKIIALVTGPFYSNQIHGGSHRILDDVLSSLAKAGHEVTLLCGRGPKDHPMYQNNDVLVKPILKLKRLYPHPWSVNLHDLVNTMETLRQHIIEADIIYNHDSQFLWCLDSFDSFNKKRIVCSVRDFIYAESICGLFSMKNVDCVIANSAYSYNVLSFLDKRHKLGINKSLICIENGIDVDYWKDSKPLDFSFRQSLHIPQEAKLLIAPVRPELNKGILEALSILTNIVYSGVDAHLVICEYVDEGFPYMDKYSEALLSWQRENKDVAKRLHIVQWLKSDKLRLLYKEADITLCAGSYPEAFGSNVYVESVAAGTPSVCCLAGAMRTTFPQDVSFLFSPGDIDGAVREINRIINMKQDQLNTWRSKTESMIRERYSIEKMRKKYVDVISWKLSVNKINGGLSNNDEIPPYQFICPNGRKYDDFKEKFI